MVSIKKSKKDIKISIGMSGGIDSSISAFLLKRQGYDVTGITLKLWDEGSRCCDLKEIERAQQFAYKIGIPHYIIDLRKEFKKLVVDYFIKEYLKGRTPNPCAVCNKVIKFACLFEKNNLIDFDFAATGHYVKIKKENESYFLSKSKDSKKSQEYFLARVEKKNLENILFPLAELTKEEVRKIALDIDFPFRTDESQEVCFIKPGSKYYEFILKNAERNKKFSCKIVNKENEVLGQSDYYFKHTIGQRKGLGISDRTPNYVLKINAKDRTIMVGKRNDVLKTTFTLNNVYSYTRKPGRELKVKIRYNHKEAEAVIEDKGDRTLVRFNSPQWAITPGQLAVFYDGDIVVGSGWIDEVFNV